ncbi:MAG: glycosyltransferase 87 family protein [Actinomycetota bacterium]|nr:glycosyltransferase 87 family protein [Actinomycetota bacterium]
MTELASSPPSLAARGPRRELLALGALLTVGAVVRCWIGFTNRGVAYDMDSIYIVAQLLATHPLHVYAALRWPYPGGFFPILLACRGIAHGLGVPLWAVVKVPTIFADVGIAAALWWGLGRLGATQAKRWAATVLVALGPSMVLISGFHGQIDASAILPALVAVIVWQLDWGRRGLIAGVLIGLGASVKTVPLFMVLALLPTARSRREAVSLLVPAVAIPFLSVLPFLIADHHQTVFSLSANKGIPGWGGLSLLAQPGLVHGWQDLRVVHLTGLTQFLYDRQNLIVGVAVLATGAYAFYRRMPPVPAAALIWLVVYATNPDMAFQYFVWGIPFFLLAGRPVAVAALQAALALPAAELYFRFAVPSLQRLYVPLMDLVWAGLAVAAVLALSSRWLTR